MKFTRQAAPSWRRDVPGVRWFKADLHIHTVDDHPGGRAKFPGKVSNPIDSEETINSYAGAFLQAAVDNGIQVLGITPHSPSISNNQDTSYVWAIVEHWNSESDKLGVPFREQIYAVFPGFQPSLKAGLSGLHMLFLFDPEIGRDTYFKAFGLVMGGISPWPVGSGQKLNELQLSNKHPEAAFDELRALHQREHPIGADRDAGWDYIVLAPHIDSKKGLLGAQKAQVLQLFEHQEIAGLELGDTKSPEDTLFDRPWLGTSMAERSQSFFYSSDAYSIDKIGTRHTWLKMATPRIEALRQAFIANDSRLRLGHEKGPTGDLQDISVSPDVALQGRPWLKSIEIKGQASFFAPDDKPTGDNRFEFSPDLTCLIGGSMTGKSTLLDGLRIHVEAPPPQDDRLRVQVEERGKGRFLAGDASVVLECPGSDTTAPLYEQWPAVFYTQNELQRLAQEPDSIEELLSHLVPHETQNILEREKQLRQLDEDLNLTAKHLANVSDNLAEAEQAYQRSEKAIDELAAISDAGVDDLNSVSSYLSRWQDAAAQIERLAKETKRLSNTTAAVSKLDDEDQMTPILSDTILTQSSEYSSRLNRIEVLLADLLREATAAGETAVQIVTHLEVRKTEIQRQVNQELAARGYDGSRISHLQAINAQAALHESYDAHLSKVRADLVKAKANFDELQIARRSLVSEQRLTFDRVADAIKTRFDGNIIARRYDDGRKEPLDLYIRTLGQRGITRWWNDLADETRVSPDYILKSIQDDNLSVLGMTSAVQTTFLSQMTPLRKAELAALRCRDRYTLELRLDNGEYRQLDSLSGGQKINLLFSLLLETEDQRPLVIDQPEDELDNQFLFGTLLPSLKRLKGRRQLILATHNANIVVNGDADQVIQLEATANRGRISCSGAIEEPSVRDAIVRTVDGGDEAFRLRHLKYGF